MLKVWGRCWWFYFMKLNQHFFTVFLIVKLWCTCQIVICVISIFNLCEPLKCFFHLFSSRGFCGGKIVIIGNGPIVNMKKNNIVPVCWINPMTQNPVYQLKVFNPSVRPKAPLTMWHQSVSTFVGGILSLYINSICSRTMDILFKSAFESMKTRETIKVCRYLKVF